MSDCVVGYRRKIRLMHRWSHKQFERKSRSIGRQRHKMLVGAYHPRSQLEFVADNVAEDAALLKMVMLLGRLQLHGYGPRGYGRGDDLGMRMGQRRTGQLAIILENQDILEAAIFHQISQPLAV